ncbi:MAG: membrane-associated protein, partial [Candidatus Pacebacteria bacterium]|nr:membrane-associated protein [Candidatus Paceibacterota bacterium]
MIDLILNYIELIVVEHGALGVFVAILIEQIISPIPSILISMLAGFFLLPSDGSLSTLLWSSIF